MWENLLGKEWNERLSVPSANRDPFNQNSRIVFGRIFVFAINRWLNVYQGLAVP